MIVRDEAGELAACLAAARPAVDEIVVLDTGSQDGSAELAAGLGARVARASWGHDFAAARNRSLELARGDWVLVLDADERLLEPAAARERLQAFAARAPRSAGQLEVRNLGPDPSRALVTRFFPASPSWRFAGRIHERVLCAGAEPPRAPTGVALEHHGYRPEIVAARGKLARNAELLERELAQAPADAYLWFQLGRTRATGGEHERALSAFERALEACPDDAPFGALLLESAAYSLRALGRSRQAYEWLSQAPLDPARADGWFVLALVALDCGELARAEELFRRCLELEGTLPAGGESAPGASSWSAACNLGVMREVLGDRAGARAWYERALRANPAHPESLAGLERVR